MTEQEALRRIKDLKKFIKKKKSAEDSSEQKFKELFHGLTLHFDIYYPNSVFFLRDGDIILELKNDQLRCHYTKIWAVLLPYFCGNDEDTRSFIKNMVAKHLNWTEVTPERNCNPI